jgi:hypothetical protein
LNEWSDQSRSLLANFRWFLYTSKYLKGLERVLRESSGALNTEVRLVELRKQAIFDSRS